MQLPCLRGHHAVISGPETDVVTFTHVYFGSFCVHGTVCFLHERTSITSRETYILGVMECYATTIQSKMSKIQSSLLELNNEILTGVRYLLCLKDDAAEIVKNLNCIGTPATYLQEFMNVNSFILKYLSFLTEINCKFEILNISEKKFKSSFSNSRAISSVEISEVLERSDFCCKSKEDSTEKTEKDTVIIDEPPSESDTTPKVVEPLQAKTLRKRITKRSVKVSASKNKIKYKSKSSTPTVLVCNSNNENTDDIKNNNEPTLNIEETEGYNLNEKLGSVDMSEKQVSDVEDLFCSAKPSAVLIGKESDCDNEKFISKESVEQKPHTEDMSCSSSDITKNITTDKTACTDIQSPEGTPVAETLPTETQRSNSEVSKDASSIKSIEDKKSTQDEKAGEDCIKPEELSRILGKEYDVVIEYIKSPSEFYVSLSGKRSNLFELESMLKLVPLNKAKVNSKKVENKKALLSKEIGNYALFYSRCDEMWCRVKITNWCLNLNDNFVTVFLLDYGETKCASIDDLCQMPERFKKYPAFIHRCHLQGIIPTDMEEKSETLPWDKASSEKMKSLTENSKTVKIRIGPNDCFHPSSSLPVTLWLTDDNECVNQLLVKSKYALWSSDQPMVQTEMQDCDIVENEKLKNWNPMREDFESYLNTYDLNMNDPAAAIYGYSGRDYDRICKHFAKNGSCFKGIACKKEHKKLDPLGFTTDEEEVYKNAFNILPSPSPNSVLKIRVTCLVKFNQFFCISESNSLTSCEEDLQSLLNCMNTVENIRDMKKLLIPPSTGQIVIARYSEDQFWYRARVLESQPEKDMYNVVFVDYGNKETVPLSFIRAIEPRFLHLPFQAMQCFIFGVDQNPKANLNHVMDYMYNKINEEHITIEVIACLPGDYINLLVNVFDQNGRNIGKDLIEMEYAVKKEEMVISSDSESMPG